MSLEVRLLPARRLWWFLTDWTTTIYLAGKCYCGTAIAYEGRGFHYARLYKHPNKWCRHQRFYNDSCEAKHLFCRVCWSWIYWCALRYLIVWKYYVRGRWAFRLKYNWGIGLNESCRAGKHHWPPEPENWYSDPEGIVWVAAHCLDCGAAERWRVRQE